MMIVVNVINETLVGSVNGRQFGVAFDEEKYKAMKDLELKASKAATVEEMRIIVADFELLTQESFKEIVETACPYLMVNKSSNKYYLRYQQIVSSVAIPQILVDKILTLVEKKLPVDPIIKFIVRMLRSEKFRKSEASRERLAAYVAAPYTDFGRAAELESKEGLSPEQAILRATSSQVGITMEGLLVGYKVSKEVTIKHALDADGNPVVKKRYTPTIDEDTGLVTYAAPEFQEDKLFEPAVKGQGGDSFWCIGVTGHNEHVNKLGHHIRVGCVHKLSSWGQVNCNDSQSCVKGLHIGGLSYIKNYQNEGTVTHNILVDPMHIGAVCDISAGSDGALRVIQYMVASTFNGVNKGIYHSSSYASMTDDEYKLAVQEAVKATSEEQQKLAKETDERLSLIGD